VSNGRDLREQPWEVRRLRLTRLLEEHPVEGVLAAQYIAARGKDLYRLVCEKNLEGIVAKHRLSFYGEKWIKIKNPAYTQEKGRREFFIAAHRS
jgi:bifunctional non-homologous end joining protein LigD